MDKMEDNDDSNHLNKTVLRIKMMPVLKYCSRYSVTARKDVTEFNMHYVPGPELGPEKRKKTQRSKKKEVEERKGRILSRGEWWQRKRRKKKERRRM